MHSRNWVLDTRLCRTAFLGSASPGPCSMLSGSACFSTILLWRGRRRLQYRTASAGEAAVAAHTPAQDVVASVERIVGEIIAVSLDSAAGSSNIAVINSSRTESGSGNATLRDRNL
eukprot:5531811-Amphidinium_carterae.3